MSLIEKKHLNYLTTVEQFFLGLKNSGLSLSGNDYHLISRWEERGVPVERLCRAIDRGVGKSRERNARSPLSLTYLSEFIEEEIGSGAP